MTPWLLARASGLTAYAAFSVASIAGLMLTTKIMGKRASRNLTVMHEAFSIAGLLLIPVHALAILNDAVFHFTWKSLLIPGLSPYAPVAVGAGVAGGWLALIVVGSFYVRKKIGPRNWRRIHCITPVTYGLMAAHGIASGSDTGSPAVAALYTVSIGLTLVLLVYRLLMPKPVPRRKVAQGLRAIRPGLLDGDGHERAQTA